MTFLSSVHIKIQVPESVHKHNQQTTYKEAPTTRYEITYIDPNTGKNEHIVVHSNDFSPEDGYAHKKKYSYNPEKKQRKHKKAGKKKSKKERKYDDDSDFKKILENYDSNPEKSDDEGGFKTAVHTEHYEVKKINPNARYPDEKYIIEGAYKVQETDPWGKPVTAYHKYDSPISKIAASILTNYDYTNLRPGDSDNYHQDKDEERDHEKIEYGSDDDSNSDGYEDYGNNKKSQKSQDYSYDVPVSNSNENKYEKSSGYEVHIDKKSHYTAPQYDYGPVQASHQNVQVKPVNYNKNQNVNFNPDDSRRVENLQKRPEEVEYVAPKDNESVQEELEYEFEKEFGHLVQPGHSEDSHNDYDSDWEKHLIGYLYGENHAASNKFVQKVKPQDQRKV